MARCECDESWSFWPGRRQSFKNSLKRRNAAVSHLNDTVAPKSLKACKWRGIQNIAAGGFGKSTPRTTDAIQNWIGQRNYAPSRIDPVTRPFPADLRSGGLRKCRETLAASPPECVAEDGDSTTRRRRGESTIKRAKD
jgi:hypothetical protein